MQECIAEVALVQLDCKKFHSAVQANPWHMHEHSLLKVPPPALQPQTCRVELRDPLLQPHWRSCCIVGSTPDSQLSAGCSALPHGCTGRHVVEQLSQLLRWTDAVQHSLGIAEHRAGAEGQAMSLKTGDTIAGYGGRICASATPVLLLEVLPDLWIRAAVIPQPGSGRRAVAPTIDTWMPVGASKQNLTAPGAPASLLTNETGLHESQSANDARAGASAGAVAPVPWTGCCSSRRLDEPCDP